MMQTRGPGAEEAICEMRSVVGGELLQVLSSCGVFHLPLINRQTGFARELPGLFTVNRQSRELKATHHPSIMSSRRAQNSYNDGSLPPGEIMDEATKRLLVKKIWCHGQAIAPFQAAACAYWALKVISFITFVTFATTLLQCLPMLRCPIALLCWKHRYSWHSAKRT